MQKNHTQHLSGLLLATLFISTSGVLGKYIAMPSEVIVWFRSAFAAIFLFIFCKYKKFNLKLNSKKDYVPFTISALFMAAHWITYFYALKLSNVALGMLSLFTFPVIIALLEPLFIKTKFNPIHIVLGILVFIGVYILAPNFDLESNQIKGILFGVLSAFCYAIRILILKQHVTNYNGTVLMLYQTLIITICIVPILFIFDVSALETQLPYLLLLGLLTTAIGHSLLVHSLNYFSVSTASIIASVQPIFGIILAYFFLNEIPTWNTFWGGLLILSTVVIESVRSKKG